GAARLGLELSPLWQGVFLAVPCRNGVQRHKPAIERIRRERGSMRRSRVLVGAGIVTLVLFASQISLTQPTSDEFNRLLQAIESLKAGQQALSNDVQEIKRLLSSRGDDRSPIRDINTTINIADAFSKGSKQAILTLVEFTDYQ